MKLNFLKDGLSINETKVSSLVITFLIAFASSTYFAFVRGDVPSNYLTMTLGLITALGTVNGLDLLSKNKIKGGK
jgi:hypothetical protein